jgi:hypothetical protein
MRTNFTVPKRVQGTRIKYVSVFRDYICYVQACSVNTLEWFSEKNYQKLFVHQGVKSRIPEFQDLGWILKLFMYSNLVSIYQEFLPEADPIWLITVTTWSHRTSRSGRTLMGTYSTIQRCAMRSNFHFLRKNMSILNHSPYVLTLASSYLIFPH